jgi:hypothetical protein
MRYLSHNKKGMNMSDIFNDAGTPGVAVTPPVMNVVVPPPQPITPPVITTNMNTTTDNSGTVINKDITINRNDPNAALLEPTWMNQWKEVLAYTFSAVILFDFMIAPIMTMCFDVWFKAGFAAWTPLTLGSGGLFYVAMAAILSVGAYGSMVKSRELIRNLPDMSR